MDNDKKEVFPQGIIFKKPREGAPEFVKGSLSFKVEEFVKYLQEKNNNGWVNIDILKSKEGKIYLKLNDWKPAQQTSQVPTVGEINYPKEDLTPGF